MRSHIMAIRKSNTCWRNTLLLLQRARTSERFESENCARVVDTRNGLYFFSHEVTDVSAWFDVKFRQEVEVSGGRIDFGGDLGVRKLIGNLVGLAQVAFYLDEEGNHAHLRLTACQVWNSCGKGQCS